MSQATATPRDWMTALKRGAACRCPACGRGAMFGRYLKVAPACTACGEPLDGHRADDAPAYVVMMIVGHLVVAAALAVEMRFVPPLWLHALLWLPLTLALSLVLLPIVKGGIVGLQWAHRMHGFSDEPSR